MPGDYQILAMIHDEIHMGEFAKQMTARLLDYAQRNNWLGRQILDLGCGSGEALVWLSQHGYIVTGIDKSAEMLTLAQEALKANGVSASLIHGDFTQNTDVAEQDMVLALNVLNELNNIRELEQTFKHIHSLLRDNKWFVFDFYTVEGLVMRHQEGQQLEFDDNGVTIFESNSFDYEKLIQSRNYIIFREDDDGWQRYEAQRILRAYPIQGVTALVKRCGFNVEHVLNLNLNEHRPNQSTTRVIIFATKG